MVKHTAWVGITDQPVAMVIGNTLYTCPQLAF